jgi:adenylylsulfate kinase-like enzyme
MTSNEIKNISFNCGKPPVVWITGMSGCGKSTIATELVNRLRRFWPNTIMVDGDSIREICGNDLQYTKEDRLKNAYRISKMCKFLQGQNSLVVCSTISFFHQIHQWNRENLTHYIEVLLKVELDELERRNSKGLYGQKSSAENVVGIDQILEEPLNPNIILTNSRQSDLDENLNKIQNLITQYCS